MMAVWEDSMKLPHRRKFLHLGLIAALSFLPHIARAQGYPSRPITIIVPFVAGGPSDWLGRLVAERLRVSQTDFEPVGLLSNSASLVVARKSLPADDLKGLVEWLKANRGKATEGHVGIGSVGHLGGLLLQDLTGTRFQQVPYRGSAPVMQDLVAGQIDFGIEAATTSLPQFRAGNIKAFAVARQRRLTSAMEIPTVDEAGLPGFYVGSWFALYAPKGTPNGIVSKLNAEVRGLLEDPATWPRFAELGHEIPASGQQTPEALAALQRADIAKWWPIIKGANVKGE